MVKKSFTIDEASMHSENKNHSVNKIYEYSLDILLQWEYTKFIKISYCKNLN